MLLSLVSILSALLGYSVGESFPGFAECKSEENGFALLDGRKWGKKTQCRVPCKDFNNPHVRMYNVTDSCNVWTLPEFTVFVGKGPVCIPRGVCIKMCGKEKPGCVYTGSCGSQTCFEAIEKGDSVKLKRITYAGPGSVVQSGSENTDQNFDVITTRFDVRAAGLYLSSGVRAIFTRATENCDGETPFVDSRKRPEHAFGQCRTLCQRFGSNDYEVILVRNSCPYYLSNDFMQYFQQEPRICVPHNVCEHECGPAGPGCVYTGTCKNKFCFSGVKSNKPADVDFNGDLNGLNISMSVDNSVDQISIDPPIFSNLPFSIDSGDHLPGPGISVSPSPHPAAKPSVSAGSTPHPNSDEQTQTENQNIKEEDSNGNVWVWVGPVLGTVMAAIIGVIGMVLAAMIRNKGHKDNDSSSFDDFDVLS